MKEIGIKLEEISCVTEMSNWKKYAIRYKTPDKFCFRMNDGVIWLPPHINPSEFEKFLLGIQNPDNDLENLVSTYLPRIGRSITGLPLNDEEAIRELMDERGMSREEAENIVLY